MTDFLAQQKVAILRRKLDALHYSGPFNYQSAALVESLLNNVITSKQALEEQQAVIQKQAAMLERHQHSIAPLKQENERVVKENNKLHYELIQIKQGRDQSVLGLRKTISTIEQNSNDLRFVITQKELRQRDLQRENIQIKERLEEVMQKIYSPASNQILKGHALSNRMITQRPSNLVTRKEDLSITRPIDEPRRSSIAISEQLQRSNRQNIEQSVLIQLDSINNQLNEKQNQNLLLLKQNSQNIAEIQKLREKLGSRDKEISRLGHLFEGGQHLDLLKVEYVTNSNAKTIEKLQYQNDFLNRQMKDFVGNILNRQNHRLDKQILQARELVRISRPGFKAPDKSIQNKLQEDILKQRQTIAELRNNLMFKNNQIEDLKSKKKPDNRVINLQSEVEELTNQIEFLKSDNAKKSKNNICWQIFCLDQIQSAFNSDQKAYNQSIRAIKQEKQELQRQKVALSEQLMNSNSQIKGLKNQINITSGKCLSLERQIQKLSSSKPISKSPNKQNTAPFSNMHRIKQQDDDDVFQRKQNQIQEEEEEDIDNHKTYKLQ